MTAPTRRILIVDDEPRSQMRVQFALEQFGFQCDLASSGQDALELVAENRYHVVVTELILPNTNGGEFVINLCAQELAPIIVVHTRTLEEEVYRGLKEEGVDAIVYKPTDYTAMARNIQSLAEGHTKLRTAGERLKKWSRGLPIPADNGVLRSLRKGDEWIQESPFRVEAFRFAIIVLACILIGLGWGNSLDHNIAGICKMFGLCGFAFYFCLELVAYQRNQYRSRLIRWSAERRLDEQRDVTSETLLLRKPGESPQAAQPVDA